MNMTLPIAPLVYFALLMSHLIVHYITLALWRAKQKLLARYRPGFDATFEVVDQDEFITAGLSEEDSHRIYERFTSREEIFYTSSESLPAQ